MRELAFGLVLVTAGASSCTSALPPKGQIVFHVATDAPLPAAPGDTTPTEVPPLFDRLRIAVVPPGGTEPCAGCSREFDVDRTKAREGRLSAGFLLRPHVEGYRARVDLYRAIAVSEGEPIPRSTITHVVSLPPIGDDGVIDVGVFLSVDEVGQEHGTLDAPEAPIAGAPDPSKTGTWPGAKRVPCNGAPNPGEVCAPGGAYWWGHPLASLGDSSVPVDNSPHLVVLSPFWVDATETRVSEFRASRLAVISGGKAVDPVDRGSDDPARPNDDASGFCTYTTAPSSRESAALNCVSRALARKYCQSRGGDLLTDAQHGYLESGLASNLFVWGNDPPSCTDAVFGRGGAGDAARFSGPNAICRPAGSAGGPLDPGTSERDRLALPGGVLYDVAGNLSEWVLDKWNRSTEPCWTPLVLTDPICTSPSASDGDITMVRGGAWTDSWDSLESNRRLPYAEPGWAFGIRCARPAL